MLLDTGVGILLAILVSKLYGAPLAAKLVAGGIVFSLLPDVDVIPELLIYGNLGGYEKRIHREWVHYPLLYALFTLGMYFFFGAAWATLFGISALAHFIHDSVGIGWGIKWLGPFVRDNYKFFSDSDGTPSGRLLVRWTPREMAEALQRHHNPNWFRDTYLRPSVISAVEFTVFAAAVIALVASVYR